jgi:tetratricopeptide (TPR) repeat protein
MFNGVGPSKADGRNTEMLRDILDRTAERVGSELRNQPAVQAQVCSLIAKAYLDICIYDQAAKMDRIALVNERKLYGPKSAEAAASLYHLGMALLRQAKLPEAEKELREALSIRQHLFSPTHADVAASLDGLGSAYRDQWRLTEADPLIRRALQIRRQLFPGNNLAVAESLQSLCRLLEAERHWPEAEEAARECLDMCRHLPGREDLVAEALDDLAMAAGFNGKLDVQEKANKEAFAIKEQRLSEDHPYMVKSIANLGEIMRLRGNSIEAHAVLLGVISIQRKLLGEDYHDTLASMGSLGQLLASEGKWEEAENLHRAALTSWRKRLGDQNPQSLWEWGELCRALVAQRKYHEAEELLARVLTPEFVTNPACSRVLAHRLDLMGRQGRWREAAADATTLMQYHPTEYYWSYNVAALGVMTHDQPAYERLCQRIPAIFAGTSNPYIAQRIAEGCLLLPNSGADRRLVQQLATRAVTLGDTESGGCFQACKGLSEYREGRFSEACKWAEKALQKSKPFAQAEGCAVLAMAQWRLGLRDKARASLSQGNKLAPELSSTGTVDLGSEWLDWLIARILLDEATELVTEGSTPANNSRTQ